VLNKYGLDIFRQCTDMLLEYCEKKVRAFIASLPDGDYTGVDYLDDDGFTDDPIKLQVNVHKRGDGVKVDFEGSTPQVGAISIAPTRAAQELFTTPSPG
jgi:N-methylhydantoinase B